MSSLWGYTSIVLEGESAKNVYSLIQKAKEEALREENNYCSEIIAAGEVEYCFGHGLIYEYEENDNEFAPRAVIGKSPAFNHFALYRYPINDDDRTLDFEGKLKYKYDGTVLEIDESTYAGTGEMLPFLYAFLGENCPELFYWISNEADYIGETNDVNHKYFDPEADYNEMM